MYREEEPAPANGPSVMGQSSQQDNRSSAPKQGGHSTGNAGTAGSTPSGCQADRELAAALAGELPAAPGKAQVVDVPFGCPPGSRGAAFTVTDGSKAGTVSIVLVPKGTYSVAPLGAEVQGTANAQSEAASGNQLHVVSQPDPNVQPVEAPYTDTIAKFANDIAPRF
ncbi:hypothetical protein [Actinosynnema sp. ALI-1.44]|uniref:hypothetical protein n=1 Tax=Actinosynnema sp. ALI-1.44 TaxID=1933779 RepID=UPI00117736C5|nr:hypothetical protein [Actinosynnema sp. ALI-1.44]